MLNTSYLDWTSSAVKELVKDKKKKKGGSGKRSAAATVINAKYNPFLDACRGFLKKVGEELLRHPAWESDLFLGLVCVEYSVRFELPKGHNTECS